jgi:FeS assembly SUF system protein
MNDHPEKPHPEGAARLVDPSKVRPVESRAEVDHSLMSRGAPGQAADASPKGEGTKDTPEEPSAPDLSKLPKDDQGQPRNLTLAEAREAKEAVVATLRTVFDPEIPVNIYELGLVYNVSVSLTGEAHVKMTLTSPACPVAGTLPPEVEHKLRALPQVTAAKVELVWDPPWNKSMMSEAARLELNVM